MNRQRRNAIEKLVNRLNDLGAEVEELQGEEEDAFEALPENFQIGAQGEAMEAAKDALTNAINEIADAVESLEEAAAGG